MFFALILLVSRLAGTLFKSELSAEAARPPICPGLTCRTFVGLDTHTCWKAVQQGIVCCDSTLADVSVQDTKIL